MTRHKFGELTCDTWNLTSRTSRSAWPQPPLSVCFSAWIPATWPASLPIGMRTLALVSLGAAVVSLSTINFQNFEDHTDTTEPRGARHLFKGSWAASASSAPA